MFWGIHKTDTLPDVLQELCARAHIEQNTGLAFLTQCCFTPHNPATHSTSEADL